MFSFGPKTVFCNPVPERNCQILFFMHLRTNLRTWFYILVQNSHWQRPASCQYLVHMSSLFCPSCVILLVSRWSCLLFTVHSYLYVILICLKALVVLYIYWLCFHRWLLILDILVYYINNHFLIALCWFQLDLSCHYFLLADNIVMSYQHVLQQDCSSSRNRDAHKVAQYSTIFRSFLIWLKSFPSFR